MIELRAVAGPPRSIPAVLVHALVYAIVGTLSLSTAFVQPNTAAVWIPSGYATGLLLAEGLAYWPAVALGAFALNTSVNLLNDPSPMAVWGAAMIAAGNTLEALIAAHLTRRYCGGSRFLYQTRHLVRFLVLPLPLAPVASVASGLIASGVAGLQARDGTLQVALTWYVADAAGILTFTGLTLFVLSGRIPRPSTDRLVEGILLVVALALASQAVCGIYIAEWIRDWPKTYMIIPLLLWASYRFGSVGGLTAIALITVGASIGTLRGFQVFPADSEWRALTYLQIYLAMLAVMTLSITAALAEAMETRTELANRVRARTRAVEQLMQRRRVMTALVAHDLQSPIYGMRSTVRTMSSGLESGSLELDDIVPALGVIEDTCTAIGERIDGLLQLPTGAGEERPARPVPISRLLASIAASHKLRLDARGITLAVDAPDDPHTRHGAEVEHILDALIDNAIRFAPEGGTVDVAVTDDGRDLKIRVADDGPGIEPERVQRLFKRDVRRREDGSRPSLGLALAAEQARWLDGSLTYEAAPDGGSVFTLTIPAEA